MKSENDSRTYAHRKNAHRTNAHGEHFSGEHMSAHPENIRVCRQSRPCISARFVELFD